MCDCFSLRRAESKEYVVGGARRGRSDAMIIVFFIMESVLGNVTAKELGFVVYVLVILVMVKALGVVLGVEIAGAGCGLGCGHRQGVGRRL